MDDIDVVGYGQHFPVDGISSPKMIAFNVMNDFQTREHISEEYQYFDFADIEQESNGELI